MFKKSWCLGLVLLSVFTLSVNCQEKKEGEEAKEGSEHASVWMRKKMEYSQHLLEGIATADLDMVADNARAMQGLSKVEAFVRGRTPGYRTQLQIFQAATEDIIRQADKDNLDGAALAFTQMTISCVNCHKHLREIVKR